MAGRGMRRSLTISDQHSTPDSPSAAADAIRRGAAGSGRGATLMDIIREEQRLGGDGGIRNPADGTVNWKSFKDRLRLRRAGNAWTDAISPPPGSDAGDPPSNPIFARSTAVRTGDPPPPPPQPPASAAADFDPTPFITPPPSAAPAAGEPVRMSLMALLEQTGSYSDEDEDGDGEEGVDDEEDDDGEENGGGGGTYNECCVCMVRHKGAAFIPCGHTFCRLCSRELWVSRGNCPLCNGFILEILDIF